MPRPDVCAAIGRGTHAAGGVCGRCQQAQADRRLGAQLRPARERTRRRYPWTAPGSLVSLYRLAARVMAESISLISQPRLDF